MKCPRWLFAVTLAWTYWLKEERRVALASRECLFWRPVEIALVSSEPHARVFTRRRHLGGIVSRVLNV